MSELRECPFCNCASEFVDDTGNHNGVFVTGNNEIGYKVICTYCERGDITPFVRREDAITSWNNRTGELIR